MKRDLTIEDYEVIIRRLIFSNWEMVTHEGENPKARLTINYGVTRYTWEGHLMSSKISEPLDWLYDKIIRGMK